VRRYRDPVDLDAEKAVLGAMVTNDRSCEEALGELEDRDFYSETHRSVFRACKELVESGKPVEHVAVASRLGEDGRKLVFSLVEAVPTYSGMPQWIASLKEHSMRRGVLARAEKVVEAATLGNPLSEVEELNAFATDTQEGQGVQTFGMLHEDYIERVMLRKAGETTMGIPTGLPNLDRATTGWHDGDLIIIAARPSQGKTVFAWQSAVNAARHGYSVFVMNLEMAFERIHERVCCAISGVSYEDWRRGKITAMDAERLIAASAHLSELPIKIHNPRNGTSIADLKRAVRATRPDIVFVDYLQLLESDASGRADRYVTVTLVSNDLKQLALAEHIPVIAVSQLSRSVDDRFDKRPVLSDLRESGYIEQDADVVLALYRDYWYYREGVRDTANGPQAIPNFHPQKVEFIARKDREGGNWSTNAYFEGKKMWMSEVPYAKEEVA
jgi:replicative DNA helicase